MVQGVIACDARKSNRLVTRVASLEAETYTAAERILDVSGVTDSQQASIFEKGNLYDCATLVRLCYRSQICLFWGKAHPLSYVKCNLAGTFQLDQAMVSSGFHELSRPQGMPSVRESGILRTFPQRHLAILSISG